MYAPPDVLSNTPSFGSLASDHYIAAHWVPDFPLSKEEQGQQLLTDFINLGEHARLPHKEMVYSNLASRPPPNYVPQDFLAPSQRAYTVYAGTVFWVRTYYDTQADGTTADEGVC